MGQLLKTLNALAALVVVSAAQAGPITLETASASFSISARTSAFGGIGVHAASGQQLLNGLTFQAFDSSLGALTSVTLDLQNSVRMVRSYTSGQATSGVINTTATGTGSYDVYLGSSVLLNAGAVSRTATCTLNPTCGPDGNGVEEIFLSGTESQMLTIFDPSILSSFTGAASDVVTLGVSVDVLEEFARTAGPIDWARYEGNASWGGSLRLAYEYVARPSGAGSVPEPGTLALAVLAIAGLVAWHRRAVLGPTSEDTAAVC